VYPGILPSAEAQSEVTGLLVKDLKETEVVRELGCVYICIW
jgi:hypothetical protein